MNNTNITCPDFGELGISLHFCAIPAVTIILILAFLEKRKNTEHCNGRPGILLPLHFLDGYYNRWSYSFAFGAMTYIISTFIFNYKQIIQIDIPLWADVFLIYFIALELCVDFYPLFACLSTPYKLVGGILGVLYSLAWLVINILWLVEDYCNLVYVASGNMVYSVVILLVKVPIIVSLVFLTARFSWGVIDSIVKGIYFHENEAEVGKPHQMTYVRQLLAKNRPSSKEPEGRFSIFRYRRVPGFRFSSRICVTMFMLGVFLYWAALLALPLGGLIFDSIRTLADEVGTVNTTILPIIKQGIDVLEVWWYIVTILTLFMYLFYIYLILFNYKKHLLRLYRGEKSFLPDIKLAPQYILAASMRYQGYQVVYMVFGYIVAFFVLFVTGSFVVIVAYVLDYIHALGDFMLALLQLLAVPAISLLLFYCQVLLVRHFLLQKKINPDDKDRPLAVDNRRVYENVSYYLLFANFTVGLFSIFWRLFVGLVLGLFMIGRMERSLFMKGYEGMDKGYLSYLSMLLLDCSHNHPVLRVFCKMLIDSQTEASLPQESPLLLNYDTSNSFVSNAMPRQNKLASNRWHLAYTLINNPRLIVDRHGKYDPMDQSGRKFVMNFGNNADHEEDAVLLDPQNECEERSLLLP